MPGNPDDVNSQVSNSEISPVVESHFSSSRHFRMIALLLILAMLAALLIFASFKKSDGNVENAAPGTEVENTEVAQTTEVFVYDENVKTVWYTEPMLLPDQKLVTFKDGESDEYKYYEIGTYGNGKIVMLNYYYYFSNANIIFLVDKTGTRLLLNHSTKSSFADFNFSPSLILDSKIKFSELSPQSVLSIGNGRTLYSSYEAGEGKEVAVTEYSLLRDSSFSNSNEFVYSNIEVIGTTPEGEILRGYNVYNGTAMYRYALKLAGGLYVPYTAKLPEYVTVDRVLQVAWNDTNTKNTEMYRVDGMGSCGGGGPEVAIDKVMEADRAQIGKTITGENVYVVTNPNHYLIERVFAATQGMVYDYDAVTGETITRVISRDEFIAAKGVVIVEESDGTQLIFTHGKYGPQAECGKPVVYLYPEEVTDITVKVDAFVTKSEPEYLPNEGWKATAYPDGTLVVGRTEYKNLFWDGYGNGIYNKPEEGVVVPTETALSVMADNLKTMGFNENEIADFVEFWSDYLPEEPYTRITWLQTREMEELAHLSIEPKPDTLLRAFVDYEGVNEPYDLNPQTLQVIERKGYVVTEWGGLLRKN